ncbi:MAG: hypothetical protein ABIS47_01040 [Acidimicrobiales bacterium]
MGGRPRAGPVATLAAVGVLGLPTVSRPAENRCSLADSRITESSGVASASWSDDVVFTHNDSGDEARIFAVDTRTCATRSTFRVTGAVNVDWEDLARGAAPDGTPVLWVGDIGDNRARRPAVVVYEVGEPGPGAPGPLAIRSRWALTYPDGAHDAETILVDPETGRPVIVTKDLAGGTSVAYRLPTGGSGVLEPLARLNVRGLPGGGLANLAGAITAGATSPDRRTLVLRSYLAGWRWTATPGEPLAATLARPPEPLDLPVGRQAEALAFTSDGRGLWATSEGARSPLYLVPLPPAGVPGGPAVEAGRGAEPTSPDGASSPGRNPADRSWPVVAAGVGAGVALLAGMIALLRRSHRNDPKAPLPGGRGG